MDWQTFMFGVVVGALSSFVLFGIIAPRFMRPFMRAAAKQRQASTGSMVPPINWGTTGNEWTPSWKKEDSDAN